MNRKWTLGVLLAGMFAATAAVSGCAGSGELNDSQKSLEPVAAGSAVFQDDKLYVSVQANAQDEQEAPRIVEADIYIDSFRHKIPVSIDRWHGRAGYGQTAAFEVPLRSGKVNAVLYIRCRGKMYEMTVPFRRDDRNLAPTKWRRDGETVRVVGATGPE